MPLGMAEHTLSCAVVTQLAMLIGPVFLEQYCSVSFSAELVLDCALPGKHVWACHAGDVGDYLPCILVRSTCCLVILVY